MFEKNFYLYIFGITKFKLFKIVLIKKLIKNNSKIF